MQNDGIFDKHGARFVLHLLSHFHYVGSRSVLEETEPDLVKNSDLDFMISESKFEEERAWVIANGFYLNKIETHYMDDHTVAVWQYTPKFNKDDMRVTSIDDRSEQIQIVVKRDESYDKLKVMWATFRANPSLFRDYFWKSNPKAPLETEIVKSRVNHFIAMLG